MSRRITPLGRALVGKRLIHDHVTYTVRGVWIEYRQNKGEKYLVLNEPDARQDYDTSTEIELDGTSTAW